MIAHLTHGYLTEEYDGVRFFVGRVAALPYVPESDDLYLPLIGDGFLLPDDIQAAILAGRFTGRLVPYRMCEPVRVGDTH